MDLAKRIIRIVVMSGVGTMLIVACANNTRWKSIHKTPTGEVADYVKFVNIASKGKLGKGKTTIGFLTSSELNRGDGKGNTTVGRCYMHLNEIDINSLYWKFTSPNKKFILLAHELHHCECLSGHNEIKFEDGCPSYMTTTMPSEKCINDNFEKYAAEIEKGCDL